MIAESWRCEETATRIAIKAGRRTVAYVQIDKAEEERARLIAAAPELLAALKEAEDLLCAARKELTLEVLMKMRGTIERAQAAIAKAEGRA